MTRTTRRAVGWRGGARVVERWRECVGAVRGVGAIDAPYGERVLFSHDLGDGVDLALRDTSTADDLHALTVRELARLRQWEHWAHGDHTPESSAAFTRLLLQQWLDGTNLPVVIRVDGEVAGSASARFDAYAGTAELGYWLGARFEGRGAAARACRALIGECERRGVARVEIRTASGNVRSRRLAERLGFTHEGTLRAAMPVGEARHDVAVYGLVL